MMRASSAPRGRGGKKQKFSLHFSRASSPHPSAAKWKKKWKGIFWFCFAVIMYALYYTLAIQCKFNYHIDMSSGKKLGENLRKWRLKKNMSQGDLATALSVDRAYISNIENGRMNPTLSTLEKIAGALGISSSELLK